MKFRGRLCPLHSVHRTKRASFGIKCFKLCESKTGYCSTFQIYTGNKPTPKDVLASAETALKLSKSFLDKDYIIFTDNWYSSPLFFKHMSKNTYAVGTVKMNRKYLTCLAWP